MKAYSRDKEKGIAFLEFSRLLEEELEKNRQIEQDWEQRKYELSNDYGEDVAFADFSCKKCTYFPAHLEYDTDRFGYPILNEESDEERKSAVVGKDTGLTEFLRTRHNLPSSKRVIA